MGDMMKDVDMIVAVYDVTKTESFGNVTKVIHQTLFFIHLNRYIGKICWFIDGTKKWTLNNGWTKWLDQFVLKNKQRKLPKIVKYLKDMYKR